MFFWKVVSPFIVVYLQTIVCPNGHKACLMISVDVRIFLSHLNRKIAHFSLHQNKRILQNVFNHSTT